MDARRMPPTLYFYNSLKRRKEEFVPSDPGHIRIYVCGPTVYARPHLGNARSVVVYDVLYRLLKHIYEPQGARVTYVRNITDVDDKIIAAAKQEGVPIRELTARVTAQFHEDMDALGCQRPTQEPRATEYIPAMIAMIRRLLMNGCAYEAAGHVLFDVASSPAASDVAARSAQSLSEAAPPQEGGFSPWHYGMLSGRRAEEQAAGARVAVESYKRHPGDFVLWKPAEVGDDASAVFDSPWGKGRPGWHIECSAMATALLGETFDIHGGGADLMFPHHENEIAQSRCAHPDSHYARYWVHNGFLTVNGEKMAKSAGNFITVRDLLNRGVPGEVIRWALLSSHGRKPLDWTEKLLADTQSNVQAIAAALYDIPQGMHPDAFRQSLAVFAEDDTTPGAALAFSRYLEALCDDMNISKAEAVIHETREIARYHKDLKECLSHKATLYKMTAILGLNVESFWKRWNTESQNEDITGLLAEGDIQSRIAARLTARKTKNWAEADRIRDELKAQGIVLEDRPDGTTGWRRG